MPLHHTQLVLNRPTTDRMIFPLTFGGVGHPNLNFWGVRTPTTPTVAAPLSATKQAITNLISWFSVFDFTKTVKQAGDNIFSCASICQKSSQYGIILQSYCTSKKGAIFYASQCNERQEISCRRVDRLVSPSWLSPSWFVAEMTAHLGFTTLNVIGHLTIRFPICHFLLVIPWNGVSISGRLSDMGL